MSAVLVTTAEPWTDEYAEATRGAVSGSRIAAVAGLSPWVSRFTQWHRDAGNLETEPREAMEWGRRFERVILDAFIARHDVPGVQIAPGTFRRQDDATMVATPDARVRGEEMYGLVEVKMSRYPDGWARPPVWGERANGLVPPGYEAQCQWQMAVLEAEACALTVLIGGNEARDYLIVRDAHAIKRLRDEALTYLESLAAGEPPDLDDHGSTYTTLRELHPDIDRDARVQIPYPLANRAVRVARLAERADRQVTAVRSRLADALGTAHKAVYGGVVIADRRARGNGTPYIQLSKRLGEIDL